MELEVTERLKILECLPKEGNIETMKTVLRIRDELVFKEDEHIEFGIEVKEPGTCIECGYVGYSNWDGDCPKSVPTGDKEPECSGKHFVKTGKQEISWNQEAARPREKNIDDEMKAVIVSSLKKLNKEGGVTDQHLSLYEKFIGEEL